MEYETIIEYGVKLVFAIIGAIVTAYIIPWLQKRKLYETVKQLVQAAEKLAQTVDIDKKSYVVQMLAANGVTINTFTEALIESAVEELDIALGKINTKQPNEVTTNLANE